MDCHITHPPGRNMVTGQLPSMVLGKQGCNSLLHYGWQETRTSMSDKAMDMADQFKATQFYVLRKLCWGHRKVMVNPRDAPVQEKD